MRKNVIMSISISIIFVGLISGCTQQFPAENNSNNLYNKEVAEIIKITAGTYTAHGLKFNIELPEHGDEITYMTNLGYTAPLVPSTGNQLLKFTINVTCIDGQEDFYSSSFSVIDKDGNIYNKLSYLSDTANQERLGDMENSIQGEKKSGILIFSIPADLNKIFLVYKFPIYLDNPHELKFVFSLGEV